MVSVLVTVVTAVVVVETVLEEAVDAMLHNESELVRGSPTFCGPSHSTRLRQPDRSLSGCTCHRSTRQSDLRGFRQRSSHQGDQASKHRERSH
jgi:hypothetical protein